MYDAIYNTQPSLTDTTTTLELELAGTTNYWEKKKKKRRRCTRNRLYLVTHHLSLAWAGNRQLSCRDMKTLLLSLCRTAVPGSALFPSLTGLERGKHGGLNAWSGSHQVSRVSAIFYYYTRCLVSVVMLLYGDTMDLSPIYFELKSYNTTVL